MKNSMQQLNDAENDQQLESIERKFNKVAALTNKKLRASIDKAKEIAEKAAFAEALSETKMKSKQEGLKLQLASVKKEEEEKNVVDTDTIRNSIFPFDVP